jgi:hypothetical protein
MIVGSDGRFKYAKEVIKDAQAIRSTLQEKPIV